jgi:hypothetical protein
MKNFIIIFICVLLIGCGKNPVLTQLMNDSNNTGTNVVTNTGTTVITNITATTTHLAPSLTKTIYSGTLTGNGMPTLTFYLPNTGCDVIDYNNIPMINGYIKINMDTWTPLSFSIYNSGYSFITVSPLTPAMGVQYDYKIIVIK